MVGADGAHMDVLQEDTPRMATVLLYLTDTEEGGETAFPAGSTWQDPASPQRYGPFSECAQGSVAVRPRKGVLRCQGSRCSWCADADLLSAGSCDDSAWLYCGRIAASLQLHAQRPSPGPCSARI